MLAPSACRLSWGRCDGVSARLWILLRLRVRASVSALMDSSDKTFIWAVRAPGNGRPCGTATSTGGSGKAIERPSAEVRAFCGRLQDGLRAGDRCRPLRRDSDPGVGRSANRRCAHMESLRLAVVPVGGEVRLQADGLRQGIHVDAEEASHRGRNDHGGGPELVGGASAKGLEEGAG